MKVELVSITKPINLEEIQNLTSEQYIIYIARVSAPHNQQNIDTAPKLLKYCVEHGHWSVLDMVDLTFSIETSRVISHQLIRHKSAYWLPFEIQEFSQRYAKVTQLEPVELRRKGITNRQSSEEVIQDDKWYKEMDRHFQNSIELYHNMLNDGVSAETARMVLPLCATTHLYAKNSVRNWLAFFNVRLNRDTQKEHRLVAEEIKKLFIVEFPIISSCFNNFENAYNEKFM